MVVHTHKDMGFEFAPWISPTFKLYLITGYQRLKEIAEYQVTILNEKDFMKALKN